VLAISLITAAVALGVTQRQFVQTFANSAGGSPTTKPKTVTGISFFEHSEDPQNPNNHQPIQDDVDTMTFPSGSKIDQTAAPQCGASDQDFSQKGDSACPKKSKIGTGSAKVALKSPAPTSDGYIPATVTLYNGKKNTLIAYVNPQGAQPVVLKTVIKKGTTPKLIITIPVNCVLGQPPSCDPFAGDARIVELRLGISKVVGKKKKKKKTVKVPFLTTPAKCPASGNWVFTFTFHHRDNSGQEVSSSNSPCKKK
jgi:hypothetical protein